MLLFRVYLIFLSSLTIFKQIITENYNYKNNYITHSKIKKNGY